MELFVKAPIGELTIILNVAASDTIGMVKTMLRSNCYYRVADQRLFFKDMELEDGRTLEDYSIEDKATVQLRMRGRGGGVRKDKATKVMKMALIKESKELKFKELNASPEHAVVQQAYQALQAFRALHHSDSKALVIKGLMGMQAADLQALLEEVPTSGGTSERIMGLFGAKLVPHILTMKKLIDELTQVKEALAHISGPDTSVPTQTPTRPHTHTPTHPHAHTPGVLRGGVAAPLLQRVHE